MIHVVNAKSQKVGGTTILAAQCKDFTCTLVSLNSSKHCLPASSGEEGDNLAQNKLGALAGWILHSISHFFMKFL